MQFIKYIEKLKTLDNQNPMMHKALFKKEDGTNVIVAMLAYNEIIIDATITADERTEIEEKMKADWILKTAVLDEINGKFDSIIDETVPKFEFSGKFKVAP